MTLLTVIVLSIRKTESKDELAALYSSASVLFNPTYEDNYPTVNIESIACGTPVVTYDTGGSPEAVEDLKCGKVILKKDYASLLAFVDNVAAKQRLDIEKISELSNRFMTEKYIDLFEKALAE